MSGDAASPDAGICVRRDTAFGIFCGLENFGLKKVYIVSIYLVQEGGSAGGPPSISGIYGHHGWYLRKEKDFPEQVPSFLCRGESGGGGQDGNHKKFRRAGVSSSWMTGWPGQGGMGGHRGAERIEN